MQIAATLGPHVDLLICETMASSTEAKYAATAASATGLPFWVAFTIEDSPAAVLRSGEPLQEAVQGIAELPGLAAVLLNCSAPQVHAQSTYVLSVVLCCHMPLHGVSQHVNPYVPARPSARPCQNCERQFRPALRSAHTGTASGKLHPVG